MKNAIILTTEELTRYKNLKPYDGLAFKFWKEICRDRGIALENTATTAVSIKRMSENKFAVIISDRKIKKPAPIHV